MVDLEEDLVDNSWINAPFLQDSDRVFGRSADL
jgi:hypothetical protein